MLSPQLPCPIMTTALYKRMVLLPENEYTLLKQYRLPQADLTWPSDTSLEREQKLYALSLRQNRESDSTSGPAVEPSRTSAFESEITHFPKTFQSRAKRLLSILQQNQPFISWNKQGEVTIGAHNSPISSSSLTDLIYHATTPKRRNFEPIGWPEFFNALKELNIPSTVLSTATLSEMKGKKAAPPAAAASSQPKKVRASTREKTTPSWIHL